MVLTILVKRMTGAVADLFFTYYNGNIMGVARVYWRIYSLRVEQYIPWRFAPLDIFHYDVLHSLNSVLHFFLWKVKLKPRDFRRAQLAQIHSLKCMCQNCYLCSEMWSWFNPILHDLSKKEKCQYLTPQFNT